MIEHERPWLSPLEHLTLANILSVPCPLQATRRLEFVSVSVKNWFLRVVFLFNTKYNLMFFTLR